MRSVFCSRLCITQALVIISTISPCCSQAKISFGSSVNKINEHPGQRQGPVQAMLLPRCLMTGPAFQSCLIRLLQKEKCRSLGQPQLHTWWERQMALPLTVKMQSCVMLWQQGQSTWYGTHQACWPCKAAVMCMVPGRKATTLACLEGKPRHWLTWCTLLLPCIAAVSLNLYGCRVLHGEHVHITLAALIMLSCQQSNPILAVMHHPCCQSAQVKLAKRFASKHQMKHCLSPVHPKEGSLSLPQ